MKYNRLGSFTADRMRGAQSGTTGVGANSRWISVWQTVFLFLGIALLSGVLQRVTGGELKGKALFAERSASNYYIVLVGFAFYGWCGLLLIALKNRLRLSARHWPLMALILLALASVIWSGSPSTTLAKAVGLLGTTLFALVAVAWCGVEKTLRILVVFFAVWIVASGILAVGFPGFSYHSHSEYYAVHAGLYKGFYYHKNTFALVASLGIVVIALAPKNIRLSPLWAVTTFGIGILLLLLSGSAKTAFSVPAAIVVAWIMSRLTFASRVLAILAIAVFALFAYAYDLTAIASDYALSLVGRDPTLSARTDIWAAVTKFTFETNPIFGGGFGGGAWQKGLGTAVLLYVGMDPGHSHNGLVQVFAELGAIGVILICAYFGIVAAGMLRTRSSKNPYLKLMFGVVALIVVNSFAASILVEANSLYWFVMLLIPYVLDAEGK